MESSFDRLIKNSKVEQVSTEDLLESRRIIHKAMEKFNENNKEEEFPQNIILGGVRNNTLFYCSIFL